MRSFYTNLNCQDSIIGDINEDNLRNVQDIVLIVSLVMNFEYVANVDLNNDSQLNVLDIVQVVNIILS